MAKKAPVKPDNQETKRVNLFDLSAAEFNWLHEVEAIAEQIEAGSADDPRADESLLEQHLGKLAETQEAQRQKIGNYIKAIRILKAQALLLQAEANAYLAESDRLEDNAAKKNSRVEQLEGVLKWWMNKRSLTEFETDFDTIEIKGQGGKQILNVAPNVPIELVPTEYLKVVPEVPAIPASVAIDSEAIYAALKARDEKDQRLMIKDKQGNEIELASLLPKKTKLVIK